jgi:hypothetical protein
MAPHICMPVRSLLLLIILALPVGIAGAQSSPEVFISSPQIENYPTVTFQLDIRDSQGQFIHGLRLNQVVVVENDARLPLDTLDELQPGVQYAVVINPGYPFAIRDSHGVSRYDLIRAALKKWAAADRNMQMDDLSLIISGGPQLVHRNEPGEWISLLDDFEADFRRAEPSLDVLGRAIEFTGESPPRPGMGRGVLFITPPPMGDVTTGIRTLSARAAQQNIKVSVWMITTPDLFTSPGAELLKELAAETGGQFHPYSGVESLPDLEDHMASLRNAYNIAYTSGVTESGRRQVRVEINLDGQTIQTPIQTFELDIFPPNPIFLSPPSSIERYGKLDNRSGDLSMAPNEWKIEIVVDFPDGRFRELVSSFLYVDGVIVDHRTEPPFERFTWNISEFMENRSTVLQVQVVDILGVSGTSSELTIPIVVEIPKQTVWMVLARQGPLLAGIAVVFSGAVLVLVLVLGGRISPGPLKRKPKKPHPDAKYKTGSTGKRSAGSDPVTQPVKGTVTVKEGGIRRLPRWINRLHWPQRQVSSGVYAYLSRLQENNQGRKALPIPLAMEEAKLGRDPFKATLVLDDPTVDPLHAHLRREADTFRLSDAGSTAGTWVNYTPVSRGGILLENGDLIHIGSLGFKFTLREPSRIRKPVVVPKEPRE